MVYLPLIYVSMAISGCETHLLKNGDDFAIPGHENLHRPHGWFRHHIICTYKIQYTDHVMQIYDAQKFVVLE